LENELVVESKRLSLFFLGDIALPRKELREIMVQFTVGRFYGILYQARWLKPPYLASRREAAMGCTDGFIIYKMLTSEPKTGKIDGRKRAVSF
jgi:hypothetical protein